MKELIVMSAVWLFMAILAISFAAIMWDLRNKEREIIQQEQREQQELDTPAWMDKHRLHKNWADRFRDLWQKSND